MKTLYAIALAVLLGSGGASSLRAQNATFDITYSGFSPEAEAAFAYAADIWSSYLVSDVPIKVEAKMVFLLPGQLGITFPNGEINFADAPYTDVWYASCLANAIAGEELNTGEADIDVFLNSSANWYFGTDGNPGPTEYDFVSTVLHELCHGLGFLSLANVIGSDGSFGMIYAESFAPLVTSFTWPALDTLPGAFDMWLLNGSGTELLSLENPSAELALQFKSNNIFLESPLVLTAHDGEAGRIYAPSTFTLGSSLSHWNETTYPVGDPNEFMTPFASDGNANHTPGPLTLAVLDEIGWEITYDTATAISLTNPMVLYAYPNPVSAQCRIRGVRDHEISALYIYNAMGALVHSDAYTTEIAMQSFAPGMYSVVCTIRDTQYVLRISKI